MTVFKLFSYDSFLTVVYPNMISYSLVMNSLGSVSPSCSCGAGACEAEGSRSLIPDDAVESTRVETTLVVEFKYQKVMESMVVRTKTYPNSMSVLGTLTESAPGLHVGCASQSQEGTI